MKIFTKFLLGMWAIGIIYEMIDEFRTKKMLEEFSTITIAKRHNHSPEFERILNHYKEKTS